MTSSDAPEAFPGASELVIHQRQLESEGGRFGVDAVTAADAGRVQLLPGAPRDDLSQLRHVREQEVRALDHLHGERSVDDVAAGEAEMKPATGGVIDSFGDGGGEGDHVVVERLFEFFLTFD